MTNPNAGLRGLTLSEQEAVGQLDHYLPSNNYWLCIRAALSRVPVAGEAVASEPVVWRCSSDSDPNAFAYFATKRCKYCQPLYAAPPSPPVESDSVTGACDYTGPGHSTPPADDARDAARLDWLDSRREDDVVQTSDGEVVLRAHVWAVWGQCDNVRSAIDAAMTAEQAKGNAT